MVVGKIQEFDTQCGAGWLTCPLETLQSTRSVEIERILRDLRDILDTRSEVAQW